MAFVEDALFMSFEIHRVANIKTTTYVFTPFLQFVGTTFFPIFFLHFWGPFVSYILPVPS